MSERRDDTPTDRFRRGGHTGRGDAQQASARDPRHATRDLATQRLSIGQNPPPPAKSSNAPKVSAKRWNVGRDIVAAVLLLVAPLFPWNLYFGLGVPGSDGAVFALLAVATALSLLAVALTLASPARPLTGRLRVGLNVPYALLVLGFVAFDAVQTVRYGGSASVPGGVGPGAWLGISGALLSAQPTLTGTPADDDRFRKWLLSARIVGYASIALAALSVVFNLFWRTRSALPGSTRSNGFGTQNVAIIATAVVYGGVALAAVVVGSRWVIQGSSRSSRLAIIALGAATLAAGVIIWVLPLGREIDGFHGIAQNTSTAGVGFEGFVQWAAAAAVFAPLTLLRVVATHQIDRGVWRAAARKGLLLIALWCLASVLMRVTDVVVAAALHSSRSPYDSAAMAAFDVVTAALAIWLRLNLVNRSLPVAVISSLCGVLLVFTLSRIVVGIALSPRIAAASAEAGNPVYGNNLAQQITSTFDVVLSGLALCILAVAIITARFVQRRPHSDDQSYNRNRSATATPAGWDAQTSRLRAGAESPAAAPRRPQIDRPTEVPTRQIRVGTGRADATPQPPTGAPRIFRSDSSRQRNLGPPKIFRTQQDPHRRPGGGPTGEERPRG